MTPTAGGRSSGCGADMRANGGAVDGSSNAGVCVVNPYVSGDGSGNVFVGHLRPVSSAIAACETPALPRPLPAVSIAAGVVAYDDDDDDDDGADETEDKTVGDKIGGRSGGVRRGRVVRGADAAPVAVASASLGERGVDPRRCRRVGRRHRPFPHAGCLRLVLVLVLRFFLRFGRRLRGGLGVPRGNRRPRDGPTRGYECGV